MLQKEELKAKVCQEIDNRREETIGLARTILESPEPGFKEWIGERGRRLGTPILWT